MRDKTINASQMKKNFGTYIRTLRKSKGYTLTQLAAKLNMDSANLSKIENGKRAFDENKLGLLADQFNLDYHDLKDEYYSELVAKKLYENECSERVFQLAEEKVEYLKNTSAKQSKLKFK